MRSTDINALVKVAASQLGGEYRTSQKGVPHIIVTVGKVKMSLVYAMRANKWKIFHPWPSHGKPQERVYFRDLTHVIHWLDTEGRRIGGITT